MSIAALKHNLNKALESIEDLDPHCLTCNRSESELGGPMYRCWDCWQQFCGPCAKHHFGSQHQPHPITVTQVRIAMDNLVEALRTRIALQLNIPMSDREAAALYHANECLKGMRREPGDAKSNREMDNVGSTA